MALHWDHLVCVICQDFTLLALVVHKLVSRVYLFLHTGYRNEGWFDPWSLLMSFKKMAQHLGADYLHGEISNLACDRNKITSVEVGVSLTPIT